MGAVKDQKLTRDTPMLQPERYSLPMYYCFQMECRRWASSRSFGWLSFVVFFPFLVLMDGWVDGLGRCPRNNCRDAGKSLSNAFVAHVCFTVANHWY